MIDLIERVAATVSGFWDENDTPEDCARAVIATIGEGLTVEHVHAARMVAEGKYALDTGDCYMIGELAAIIEAIVGAKQ